MPKRARRARNGHGAHEMARSRPIGIRRRRGADEARPGRPVAEGCQGGHPPPPIAGVSRPSEQARRFLPRRRCSMIATVTRGMPREAHREAPESGDLVDAEVSAPREGVQGAFVAELRL